MKYIKTGERGMQAYYSHKYKVAADLLLKATKEAPTPTAKMRHYYFFIYTMILRESHFNAPTSRELKQLYDQFLTNEDEPPQFRVAAAYCLGVVYSTKGDREAAGSAYRDGLLVGEKATLEERLEMVYSDDGNLTVGYILDTTCEMMRSNLNVLMGRGRLLPPITAAGFNSAICNDGTMMPTIGMEQLVVTMDNVLEISENQLNERLLTIGGERCDNCQKSCKELGVERLKCCSRCRFMFYCSTDCSKQAWKAGHKEACRKPDEIKVGDYMKLARLDGNNAGHNGELVRVVGQHHHDTTSTTNHNKTTAEDLKVRWKVELLSSRRSAIVMPKQLKHIRPAK